MTECFSQTNIRMRRIAGGQEFRRTIGKDRAGGENSLLPVSLSRLFVCAGCEVPSAIQVVQIALFQFALLCVLVRNFAVPGVLIALVPALLSLVTLYRFGLRRAQKFEQDYTAFLLSLSSSIRTGLDPLMSLSRCSVLFDKTSVVRVEIERTVAEINAGVEEEIAYRRFASSVNHPDVILLRTALILSYRQGSSLSACLQRLAKVTRQRQSFRRKMRGAMAMQRLSAFGIAGCTIIIGIIQSAANPQSIQQAWNHPSGGAALSGGVILVVFGLLWMLYMSRGRM